MFTALGNLCKHTGDMVNPLTVYSIAYLKQKGPVEDLFVLVLDHLFIRPHGLQNIKIYQIKWRNLVDFFRAANAFFYA